MLDILERGIFFFFNYYEVLFWTLQELSPTSDTALVKSLMNLMDSLMEEFQDEAKITQMEDREIMSWLEVSQIECQLGRFKRV